MQKQTHNELEKEAFLHNPYSGVSLTFGGNQRPKSSSLCCGKKCCCCTTSWKCCGIVALVITLAIGLLLGGGYLFIKLKFKGIASSENAKEWEKKFSQEGSNASSVSLAESGLDLISGEYELVSYDENYPEYLKNMGIPFFVVPLILSSRETVKITKRGDSVKFSTKTDVVARTSEFEIGKLFEMVWGRNNGIMHTLCTMPEKHILDCHSEERVKGWNLTSKSEFFQSGFVNTREFITYGVKTKKYYARQGNITDPSFGLKGDVVTIPPEPQESPDSPFSDSDDDKFDFDTWGDDSKDDDDMDF